MLSILLKLQFVFSSIPLLCYVCLRVGLCTFLKHQKLDFQVIYWFLFSATPGRGQVPRPARKNDAAAVVHHHHLHQGQEAAPLTHAAGQGLVLRVPVLLPDLDQSLNRDPDQVLPNHQVQGKEGLVFVL